MSHHLTPEQRIESGEEYATFDDLDGLATETLVWIAKECIEPDADPDACVPCRAFTMVMERERENTTDLTIPSFERVSNIDFEDDSPVKSMTDVPVAERFASEVRLLNSLVEEMLEGPPIPPKNVTMQDLAVLTVAAQKWLAMNEMQAQQGYSLSPEQQEFLQQVTNVVGRMKTHG